MMSDNRHQLHSVSDLYAADEIEVLLLEEIRDLEPPPSAYSRPEDIQDFEIGIKQKTIQARLHIYYNCHKGLKYTCPKWQLDIKKKAKKKQKNIYRLI